jgi:hypothetical protein
MIHINFARKVSECLAAVGSALYPSICCTNRADRESGAWTRISSLELLPSRVCFLRSKSAQNDLLPHP